MNIQSLGSSTSVKLDDRPVAAEPQPVGAAGAPKTAAAQADRLAKAPPSREQVDDAVKVLNKSLATSSPSLEFSIDHDSKDIVVKLIDQSTKEVLRQIPSVEALQMAKSIDKMQGLMIHHTA
jgi:flagellar protein FlaG